MWGWCIVTLASARLKASVRFPSLRGMYQTGGICKGCDSIQLYVPIGTIVVYQLLEHLDDYFVGRLRLTIALRVISCQCSMPQQEVLGKDLDGTI